MDDIDEEYRVVRPGHAERVARQQAQAADQKRNRMLLAGFLALVAVAVVIGVIVMSGGSPDDTDLAAGGDTTVPTSVDSTTPPVDDTTQTTMTTVTTPPTTPPTQPPPVTQPPVEPGPREGTIVRSCGVSGKGDCRIAVREGPSTKDKATGRLNEGDKVVFVCTVMGEEVRSTVLNDTTAVWARNEKGTYVSMAYLDIPGWALKETTEPCP